MAAATDAQIEQLDVESISEYVREYKSRTRATGESAGPQTLVRHTEKSSDISTSWLHEPEATDVPKPDVLETLWPGLHHQDFARSVKRTPSFYLTLGFVGGALVALFATWGYSSVSSFFANYGKLSGSLNQTKLNSTEQEIASTGSSNAEVLVPLVPLYEVQDGDTLAGLAMRNYKHISPRLLDAICRANNITDANVLNLGQKLVLPEYHPQTVSRLSDN